MTIARMIELVEDLENYLGDPHDPDAPMSFERVLGYDEREQFPFTLVGLLQRWQVHEYCLPERWGGRAGDVEVGFQLLRSVGRRDPTSATALMLTDLAFMPTWIAGTDEQRHRFVRAINNGTPMAWGLSERNHGSDVLANEMRAEKVPGGYVLTGEKYLIGNATLADIVSVHARTSERGGPGGWSIFAVDKRRCPAGTVEHLPGEQLHGLRALDMSGIRLDHVFVPEENRLGPEGAGLEIALKSAQVARTTISSMSLGAVDTALRVTLDFATKREIFGQRVSDIAYTRRQLSECFADLMLAEAACTGAVRGLQANPGQASVFSSAVKYFVPTLLERTMAQLSVVLGARLYLRSDPHFGIYQKMLRDVLVAIFADGNTVVNLKNIALQLDGLLRTAHDAPDDIRFEAADRVALMYDLDATLPVWEPHRQQLFSRGRDDTILALPDAVSELRAMAAGHADDQQRAWYESAATAAAELLVDLDGLLKECEALRASHGSAYGSSAELFRLAEQYCAIHAAAAVVHLTLRTGNRLPGDLPDGALLLACLDRARPRSRRPLVDVAVTDRVMEILTDLHAHGRAFSHWQFQLQTSDWTAQS